MVILEKRGVKHIAIAAALAIACFQGRSEAHERSTTFSHVSVQGGGLVELTIRIPSADLDEVKADRVAYVSERVRFDAGGKPCLLESSQVSAIDAAVELTLRSRCPAGELGLTYDLFFDLDPRHVGWVEVGGATHELTAGARHLRLAQESGAAFIGHGVEHILTGFDHLAFVLALLVVAPLLGGRRALRHLLGVVTAFTLAHSVTLILAALGVVSVPSSLVEPAIALSIVFVAAENFWFRAGRGRALVAFGFGLVHGLGFASMLRPLLPAGDVVWPLVAFNLGVEAGQLGVVAVSLPVLLGARRALGERYRWLIVVASGAIGVAGMFWFFERL